MFKTLLEGRTHKLRINYGLNYKQGVASPLQFLRYQQLGEYQLIDRGDSFPVVDDAGKLKILQLSYDAPRQQMKVRNSDTYEPKKLAADAASGLKVQVSGYRIVEVAAAQAANSKPEPATAPAPKRPRKG